ncbi:MAG: YggS family pyridoxal phosphate-dependent enzyme [Alphaproteobacteria bacterium]|nr:YggS family pyridoxal phosphate-dependent enzyme [Alphaproteobacteria bacterium]
MSGAEARLQQVRAAIAAAAREVRRRPEDVTLVVVSKTHGIDALRPLLDAGWREFGENRVQEAETKWSALKAGHPDLRLHMIGPLQTNKIRDAVALFDVIETVDRPKLARGLADEMARSGRRPECYIQINTGEEEQKAGIFPEAADSFIETCRNDLGLPIVGLMCIPPADEEPSPHFALLREIAGRHGLSRLSMGMSDDFEVAVRLGATTVRVGSAILGGR